MTDIATTPAGETPSVAGHEPWGAVWVLMAIGVLNYLDRTLPAMLTEPIRRDLDLSDTAMGLINGFGFLLVYAIAGIPIARIADRGRYSGVIALSLGLWSVLTIIGGFARTGLHLAITRMGVALGEAGSTPSAHAFISRNFKPDRRAAALSIVTLGAPVGQMLGFIAGGYLAAMLGWRQTFIVMGLVGVVLAPIAYVVLRRSNVAEAAPTAALGQPTRRSIWELFRSTSFLLILAGGSFTAIGGYSAGFAPAFLIRVHGMTLAEAGVQLGIMSGLVSIPMLLVTGRVADRMSRRDPRWTLWTVAAMVVLCLPFATAAFLVTDQRLAVLCIAMISGSTCAYLAPVVAALHRLVPMELRARSSAILLFCSGMAGGLGPLLTGAISDALRPVHGDQGLGYALLVVPVAFGLSAACYFAATVRYRRDMVEPA